MTKLQVTIHTMARGGTGRIWALALMALLAAAIGFASPNLLWAQSERTLNLGSLTITDENGTAIDLGTFDPAVQTYSANVASTVERVTVTARPESSSNVYVNLTPGDYGSDDNLWEVEGRDVRLNHGRNLILIGVYSYAVDGPLRVYTIEINRAGSATQGADNYITSSSLSITAREGSTVPFLLTRSGNASEALTVSVDFWRTDGTGFIRVLPHIHPVTTLKRVEVEFPAGSASAIVNHETTDDSLYTGGYDLGVTLVEGTGYRVPQFSGSGRFASTTVWDDDSNQPTLASLSLKDQNDNAVAFGDFDPDNTSYTGSVASETYFVTVVPGRANASEVQVDVLPPDSKPGITGHQVDLLHGDNLIAIVVRSATWSSGTAFGTYQLEINRADSSTGTATSTVSIYGLSSGNEGDTMPFLLTRDGDTSQSLTVPVNVTESGVDMVSETDTGRFDVEFRAGDAWAKIEVPTNADEDWEEHSTITVGVVAGAGYELNSEAGSALSTVKDNDVPGVTASISVDSSQAREGEVVTATITVTTDSPKEPHNYVGNLRFSSELGTAQEEDFFIPFGLNHWDLLPEGHWITGPYSWNSNDDGSLGSLLGNPDGSLPLSFPVRAMRPVVSGGVISNYQYQISVPILIVDDDRAEPDETFDVVRWYPKTRQVAKRESSS